ncbi:MAG: alpha/beta hydrolase family protein [Synechococcus sp.]
MRPIRSVFTAIAASAAVVLSGLPASALERLVLRMPYLGVDFTINLGEGRSVEEVIQSSPDLVDLDRASEGRLLALLKTVFLSPLPAELRGLLEGSTGQPLLEQALNAAAFIVNLEGVPFDSSGSMLTKALRRAYDNDQNNLLGFLHQLPGEEASIDLSKLAEAVNRLVANQSDGLELVKAGSAAPVSSELFESLQDPSWTREVIRVSVQHRDEPLRVLVLKPQGAGNQRLVVISHGLWDDPESFEAWAEVLAAKGYVVLLPDHPGSNFEQQRAMLAGDRPPPGPEELRLRPLDVSALLTAVEQGRVLAGRDLNTKEVAVVGHSWGATTALQLAGGIPTDQKLKARCRDPRDPERNISWVLQCSWLSGINKAGVADSRVKTVVAVSPPMRLLFDPVQSLDSVNGQRSSRPKVLLISGTRDWIVPSGPEAVSPMRDTQAARLGHRLVLVDGGTHFNLRAVRGQAPKAVIGPVVLAWINQQITETSSFTFDAGRWGHPDRRLVDVSGQL